MSCLTQSRISWSYTMRIAFSNIISRLLLSCTVAASLAGCASQQLGSRSSVVEYLYPTAAEVKVETGTPVLTLPIRLGIAFVPAEQTYRRGSNPWALAEHGAASLNEPAKMQIMENIASHFRQQDFIGDIQLIPSSYLRPQGSFTNLDQLQSMFGIDVIALVSFDQVQFSDESTAALSYWTLVGAYLISGQKNDTSTLMDTAVYAINSRKLLFRAPGVSQIKGRSTPVNLAEELRQDSKQGFDDASKQMINQLEQELESFTERLKARAEDIKVVRSSHYRGGGSVGIFTLLILLGTVLLRKSVPERIDNSFTPR
ncbi:rhombotarget lipoprotein [Alishewanella longhuensis]|uniref:Rhombotarget lipoprotein n=1 Tax=Alishewanella longhuensis TaxID=1091037 RepID=A0ABQ3KXS0_9ALTE|nr:rhombotarget lipoprotein [Alishewanella longhuensis]GHG67646.1 rhombotarget lipoprotein [Alishewanella longhuensis]